MSGDKQTEQEALGVQEPQTERLLPAWLLAIIYGVGVPWCVFAVVYIGIASVIQRKVVNAVRLVSGKTVESPLPLSDPAVRDAVEVLLKNPKDGLLFAMEELQRREIESDRMARVSALRKALRWEKDSDRRSLIAEVLSHMNARGEFEEGYVLPDKDARTLKELIDERKAEASESYEEQRITEVLEWIAQGHPGQPKGPEHRRIRSLQAELEKRKFRGVEIDAMKEIIELWEQKQQAVYRQAAQKFVKMLQEQPASLSPEEQRVCEQYIRQLKEEYLKGRENLAQVAYLSLKKILDERMFLDHPPRYVMIRLLESPYKPVQDRMADCVMLINQNKFTIEYLAEAAKESSVNPVMAVETATMTKQENEALLREDNIRRRRKAIELLTAIALDWCRKRAETNNENPYGLDVPDPRAFFKNNVVEVFREIAEQKDVKDLAAESMARIRAAGPDYFD